MRGLSLPPFPPLDKDRIEFFASRRERVVDLFPTYGELRSKLLGIGGLEVVLPRYDELSEPQRSRQRYETGRIIQDGQTWPGDEARSEPMEESSCHVNTAILFKRGGGSIASGFALSEDGLWREHSWIVEGGKRDALVETTVLRLLYHGYLLSAEEQGWFVTSELGSDDAAGAA
jgi:hypothetical protein